MKLFIFSTTDLVVYVPTYVHSCLLPLKHLGFCNKTNEDSLDAFYILWKFSLIIKP